MYILQTGIYASSEMHLLESKHGFHELNDELDIIMSRSALNFYIYIYIYILYVWVLTENYERGRGMKRLHELLNAMSASSSHQLESSKSRNPPLAHTLRSCILPKLGHTHQRLQSRESPAQGFGCLFRTWKLRSSGNLAFFLLYSTHQDLRANASETSLRQSSKESQSASAN